MMDNSFEQKIRQRAYILWLRDANGRGRVDHHWFQAVRDILAARESAFVGNLPVSSNRNRGHVSPLLRSNG
jgi:hypothetical protein